MSLGDRRQSIFNSELPLGSFPGSWRLRARENHQYGTSFVARSSADMVPLLPYPQSHEEQRSVVMAEPESQLLVHPSKLVSGPGCI